MDLLTLAAKITLDSSEYDSGLQKADKDAESFGTKISNGLKNAAKWVAGGVVTKEILSFGKASVEAGEAFDKSMSQVAATMGKSVDEIGDLREFAQKMGSETAFSASQAADALNYMALAGYDSQKSMEMLPNVLNLAAAGGIELAEASDMVTDAASALGLSMDDTTALVDKMAKASSMSNTSVAQLGQAMLTVGGTAKDLYGGTTELSQALGLLADNGIKGAEGGTALRNIILSLGAPTDKQAKAMEDLGVATRYVDGRMRPLKDIFGDLNKKLATMNQGERTQVLSELFNKVDLKSANALLATNAERWDELASGIDSAKGAAEKMANTQLDNLAGDITLFQSAVEGAQIAISDQLTPALRSVVQWGSEAVSGLTNAFKNGGWEGLLIDIWNRIQTGASNIVTKVRTWITDIVNQAKQGLANLDYVQLGLDIAQKITSGFENFSVWMYEKFMDAVNFVQNIDWGAVGEYIWRTIQIAFTYVAGWLSGKFKEASDAIKNIDWVQVGTDIWKWISDAFHGVVDWFKGLFTDSKNQIVALQWGELGQSIWTFISSAFTGIAGIFKGWFQSAYNEITTVNWAQLGQSIWETISSAFATISAWFKQKFDEARTAVANAADWEKLGNDIKKWITDKLKAIVDDLKEAFENAKKKIEEVNWVQLGKDIWDWISGAFANIGQWLYDKFFAAKGDVEKIDWAGLGTAIWDLIKAAFSAVQDVLKGIFEGAWELIEKIDWAKLGTDIWDWISKAFANVGVILQGLFEGAWKLIEKIDWAKLGTDIWDWISNAFLNIGAWLKEKFTEAVSAIGKIDWVQLGKDIWENIKKGFADLADWFKSVFDLRKYIKKPDLRVSWYDTGFFGLQAPSFDLQWVEWYGKAYDNPILFTQPTIIPTASGYKGFGERGGGEVVLSEKKLRELTGGGASNNITINVYPQPGQDEEEIARLVEERLTYGMNLRAGAYA